MNDAASAAQTTKRGPGRPQARDAFGAETKERLLNAAAQACVEKGFEGTTMADIARRTGIRVPSIYNYYPTKSALLVAATRRALDSRFAQIADDQGSPSEVVAFMLSPELADTRRLALELHSAATRHDDIAELLKGWHKDSDRAFRPFVDAPGADARIKLFFLIIMGMCHIDEFDYLPGSRRTVEQQIARISENLFSGT
ncbi:MAG: TetR/AcrR family transcriptional regulator [Pseudomonadales bacterium]